MALYTLLSEADLAEVAGRFGLGQVVSAVGIPQGSINTNYRLETSSGRRFLRHTTVRGEADLEFEAALLAHLSQAGFPGPVLERTVAGEAWLALRGGRVSVFHYLSGEELTRPQVTAEHVESLGRELGKLHRLTQSFGAVRDNPYGPKTVRIWLEGLSVHPDPKLRAEVGQLREAMDANLPQLEVLLPRGTIHADLFLDNVKWLGTKVAAFFDFEMACQETYVLDLAVTLNAWCFDGGYFKPLVRALLRGYQEERPLSDAEKAALNPAAVFGAVRFCASRIRDFHLSTLPPDKLVKKDYRTYLARVEHLQKVRLASL